MRPSSSASRPRGRPMSRTTTAAAPVATSTRQIVPVIVE